MSLTRAAGALPGLVAILTAVPLAAEDAAPARGLQAEFLERLQALDQPPPLVDPYAEDKAADLARIAAQDSLFDPAREGFGPQGTPVIALFVGPDCADCAAAQAELTRLAEDLGVRVALIDTGTSENAELMQRLDLDLLPSYVMRDKLIRGHMPAMVLRRYLSEVD